MVENQKKKKIEEIERCPECGSTNLIRDYEHGELVCGECGAVIEDSYIDQGPEWRAFDSEQNESRARAGSPMTFTIHDKGLSTDISWKNKDSYGRSIPTRNRAQLYRLRKWQKRIKVSNAAERNLSQALQELERMAFNLSIPNDVRETAAVIYRKAVKQNMIRGRSIEGVVAGALYAACRITNVPRTLGEIASVTRVKKKEIGRTYRIMSRYLKLNIMPSKAEDYISRFCSKLKLSMDTRNKALEILRDAENVGLTSGKGPTGVAAAAIYIASLITGERRTQRAVAEVAGVTEVTIRNRYKELTEKLKLNVEQ
ncbi:transcription initiation factor B [TFB] [Thermoplasma volcanium GSS1]|uniref:Transcription initiation factor IIB 1 n=1 Tax=Thermoplasma volcanium (strain ATCC 51530 / DSM 4299 / JCM 9571 / NBRC 15438 / GSS1) TaxID=273116 RepID=TF2B1_THEVO|nr:transcription initiation factor IIB [Thermoplasma volcanium]Q979Q3.1 RecName: Full=Transcription initiation factor IIB 1; Short=TFIIB 1 [Thermoplasma volcanium GSS1]BAB60249.1 transcription initiation factor B [TFB] [Thermoplasma volcanium GSS1]